MIGKILTIKGHNIWITSGNPERQKAAVDFVINGLGKSALKPVVDRVFPFDKIVDAHRIFEAKTRIGDLGVLHRVFKSSYSSTGAHEVTGLRRSRGVN
jgi:NADPH:quinone reductase-like Zn-dependent oxidoreductase